MLMYANQLLDLPFLAVTRNERQKYVIRHFFFSFLAELSKHEGGGQFRWGREREREGGRHKNQKTTAQPTWWIMTAVKWITQDGEALQNIDLMLHPCWEDVHPHYARSNIPNIPWAFGFPSHSERKTYEIFLSHAHFRVCWTASE